MKVLTVLLNIVLFGFTCFVLATDGVSSEPPYIAFTLALLVVPIFTVVEVLGVGTRNGLRSTDMKAATSAAEPGARVGAQRRTGKGLVAAMCNIGLLALVCWAIVDQYPHPKEQGVLAFAIVALLAPILSVLVLLRRGQLGSQQRVPILQQSAEAERSQQDTV